MFRLNIPGSFAFMNINFEPENHFSISDEYCQDGFQMNCKHTATELESQKFSVKNDLNQVRKSMLVGFVRYLPSVRMDCTISRFTVQHSRRAASACGICPVLVIESYRTVHKIFRTNILCNSFDLDIIRVDRIKKGGTKLCRLLRRN